MTLNRRELSLEKVDLTGAPSMIVNLVHFGFLIPLHAKGLGETLGSSKIHQLHILRTRIGMTRPFIRYGWSLEEESIRLAGRDPRHHEQFFGVRHLALRNLGRA